jgi:hypothetical protein
MRETNLYRLQSFRSHTHVFQFQALDALQFPSGASTFEVKYVNLHVSFTVTHTDTTFEYQSPPINQQLMNSIITRP